MARQSDQPELLWREAVERAALDRHVDVGGLDGLWDRRADETPKSYAAFRAYVALGARRSVREAARQHCVIWAEKYRR